MLRDLIVDAADSTLEDGRRQFLQGGLSGQTATEWVAPSPPPRRPGSADHRSLVGYRPGRCPVAGRLGADLWLVGREPSDAWPRQ